MQSLQELVEGGPEAEAENFWDCQGEESPQIELDVATSDKGAVAASCHGARGGPQLPFGTARLATR